MHGTMNIKFDINLSGSSKYGKYLG